jgi:hypothetical protein
VIGLRKIHDHELFCYSNTPTLPYSIQFELNKEWLEVLTIEFVALLRGRHNESCCP